MYENEHEPHEGVPTMTPALVHDYLTRLGEEWSGRGVAVELGSWLGGTAAPLIRGLVRAGYDRPFYAYDRWEATEDEVRKAALQGVKISVGQDLIPIFRSNTSHHTPVVAHKGDIEHTFCGQSWLGRDVEVCLFDAPKRDPLFTMCVRKLAPHFVPGVTVLGLLDYRHYLKVPSDRREPYEAPVRFVERNKGRFELLAEWPEKCSCAFFRYQGGVIL